MVGGYKCKTFLYLLSLVRPSLEQVRLFLWLVNHTIDKKQEKLLKHIIKNMTDNFINPLSVTIQYLIIQMNIFEIAMRNFNLDIILLMRIHFMAWAIILLYTHIYKNVPALRQI